MPQSDDDRLVDLVNRPQPEIPQFARSLPEVRPARPREDRRPRENRRLGVWCLLALGLALMIAGMVLPDGLLIATGLVLSGIAVQLVDPDRRRNRHSGGPSAR